MANICVNVLEVHTKSKENVEYITKFFEDDDAIIEGIEDDIKKITFESKWAFPTERMEKFLKDIPIKKDIFMLCLSVEWGNAYAEFHRSTKEGWELCL